MLEFTWPYAFLALPLPRWFSDLGLFDDRDSVTLSGYPERHEQHHDRREYACPRYARQDETNP